MSQDEREYLERLIAKHGDNYKVRLAWLLIGSVVRVANCTRVVHVCRRWSATSRSTPCNTQQHDCVVAASDYSCGWRSSRLRTRLSLQKGVQQLTPKSDGLRRTTRWCETYVVASRRTHSLGQPPRLSLSMAAAQCEG